jgi:alpha-tubulin suppressor-like RCC1 family protein
MTHIQFTRRLAPVLVPAVVVAALSCREDAESPTAPELAPSLKTTQAQALSFRQVSTGANYTCGVTPDNRAYCWGANRLGNLGDGTTTDRLTPVAVVGGLRFRQVSAGNFHACGVTTNNRAYCWGLNQTGELGNGTNTGPEMCDNFFPCSSSPVALAGGLRFALVRAGGNHTCGVTPGNLAYCWGFNAAGQLGNGTNTGPETCVFGRACSTTPVAVAGGLRFRQMAAGLDHTCGSTPAKRAYCWGSNFFGQLGDGTTTQRLTPVPVAGGLQFSRIAAGQRHTCALTPDHRVYCWGENAAGQLGNGTSTGPEVCNGFSCSTKPVRIVGGRRFLLVSAGGFHTCALTPGNLAYCWGRNFEGQLGDGTNTGPEICDQVPCSTRPVRVVDGLGFRQVNGGHVHTCALTPNHRAYCWGDNDQGQLGDGTTTDRLTPVPVAGATPVSIRIRESQAPENNRVVEDQPDGDAEQE